MKSNIISNYVKSKYLNKSKLKIVTFNICIDPKIESWFLIK